MNREQARILETAFNFSTEDLYANKSGYLSPDQKKRLEALNKSALQRQISSMFIAVCVVGIAGFIYYKRTLLQNLDITKLLPFMIYLPILLVPMLIYWVRNRDLREGKISHVSGSVKTASLMRKGRNYSYVKLENVTFYLTPEQAQILQNGYFTIYYIKSSYGNRILSVQA